MLSWRAGLAVLVIAVFVAFWPALGNGFVWDDTENLVRNTHYQGVSGENLTWCLTAYHGGHYQPLTWLSFMLDHALWGERRLGYHLTNVLLHALNALLFAFLARGLLQGDAFGALIAAGVFALHPMRVESVAWVTERRDVLGSAFFLLAVLAYLQWVSSEDRRWYAVSVGLFFLSLSAKALGLALPVVLLVLDACPLRRFRWPRVLWEKLPFFALSGLFAWLALRAQEAQGALIDTGSHGWMSRVAQAGYGLVYYLRSMLALSWSPLHERPAALDAGEPRFLLSVVVVIGAAVALCIWRRRFPSVAAAAACYAALVAPVLGIAQSGVQLVADRYSYLACLPWAVLLGAGLSRLKPRAAVSAVVVAVLLLWGVLTWRQTRVWADEDTLWKTVLAHGPSAMAANNLGVSALERGQYGEALGWFVRSLAIVPTYGRAQQNLVDTLAAHLQEIPPQAWTPATDALRTMAEQPASAGKASYLLGAIAFQQGELDEAARQLERSVSADPQQGAAWQYLGVVRMQRGNAEGALDAYRRAAALDPQDGRARLGEGVLLARMGRCPEAIGPLREAARLLPDSAAPKLLESCLSSLDR